MTDLKKNYKPSTDQKYVDIANSLLNDEKYMKKWSESVDVHNKKHGAKSRNIDKVKSSISKGIDVAIGHFGVQEEAHKRLKDGMSYYVFVNNCDVAYIYDHRGSKSGNAENAISPVKLQFHHQADQIDCENLEMSYAIVNQFIKNKKGLGIISKIMCDGIEKNRTEPKLPLTDRKDDAQKDDADTGRC